MKNLKFIGGCLLPDVVSDFIGKGLRFFESMKKNKGTGEYVWERVIISSPSPTNTFYLYKCWNQVG